MISKFGPYLILEDIGHGGSAHVYSAQTKDGSRVALKIFDLGKRSTQAESVRRFFEGELQTTRSLSHPNIIKYFDAGVIDDTPYIAMELLTGGNLQQRVASVDFMTSDDILAIVSPLADALDYACRNRVLHRDVKPSNILFSIDGRPVLSDFGIARFLPSREDTTRAGLDPVGTSDFMAPETVLEGPATPASDIYSLGMTIYYALSGGALPSDGKTIFTRSRDRVEGKLVPITQRNPSLPDAVNQVFTRALSVKPGDRFASASSMVNSLAVALTDRTIVRTEQPSQKTEETNHSWLDYWRYVIVPLLVALIGAVAMWLASKRK